MKSEKISTEIKINLAEYNTAIQDINSSNFSDYCNVNFDRVQLSNIDWSVHYDDEGKCNLLYCDEFVQVLKQPQAIKVIDFLDEKAIEFLEKNL